MTMRAERKRGWPLSPRELDCVRLMARGMALERIAQTLGVSHSTVKTCQLRAEDKLGVKGPVRIVLVAGRIGYLDLAAIADEIVSEQAER